ncbi:hypothetical protein D3C81_2038010 [compost metagenome]
MIIVSSVTTSPARFCSVGMILQDGKLSEVAPLKDTIARYSAVPQEAAAAV